SRGRVRASLHALGEVPIAKDHSLQTLAQRTQGLQSSLERLSATIRAQLAQALEGARSQPESLLNSTRSVRPEIEWIRGAAKEASERLETTGSAIAGQQERLG